jgi:hypothetical protein
MRGTGGVGGGLWGCYLGGCRSRSLLCAKGDLAMLPTTHWSASSLSVPFKHFGAVRYLLLLLYEIVSESFRYNAEYCSFNCCFTKSHAGNIWCVFLWMHDVVNVITQESRKLYFVGFDSVVWISCKNLLSWALFLEDYGAVLLEYYKASLRQYELMCGAHPSSASMAISSIGAVVGWLHAYKHGMYTKIVVVRHVFSNFWHC